MYTMNRCTLHPPSPLHQLKKAITTKSVASYALLTGGGALISCFLMLALPQTARAEGDNTLPVPERVIKPGEYAGRQFPPTAMRGVMEVVQGQQILIDSKSERLSPGARIRGPQNTLIMTGAIIGERFVVNFVRDAYNNISQVWILNELEARQKANLATPATNVVFGSDAEKPKVDDGKTPFNQLPKYKQ
jgi:hypothetical protein